MGYRKPFSQLYILFYRMAALLPTAAKSWDEQQIMGASLGSGSWLGVCVFMMMVLKSESSCELGAKA